MKSVHLNKKDWDIILDCLWEYYIEGVTDDIPTEDIDKTINKVKKLLNKEKYIPFNTPEDVWEYLN